MKHLSDLLQAENVVLMDGDCVYCSRFSDLIAARNNLGSLQILNLRDRPDLVEAMRRDGLEPNQGMLFKRGDKFHYGPRAVSELARATEGDGVVRWAVRQVLRSPPVAAVLYPAMRAGRAVTLRVRGKRMID